MLVKRIIVNKRLFNMIYQAVKHSDAGLVGYILSQIMLKRKYRLGIT